MFSVEYEWFLVFKKKKQLTTARQRMTKHDGERFCIHSKTNSYHQYLRVFLF